MWAFYMLCRLCVPWCSLRLTIWVCLECLSVAAFKLVYVFLLCQKLCSYRVLQWLFAQGEPFGWTHLLRYYLVCVGSVTEECRVLYPCCMGCVCCYVGKKALLQCFCNYWDEGYGPVWGALDCVGFWDRDYVSQLSCVRYYVFVKSSFKILMRNASPRGPMCFWAPDI